MLSLQVCVVAETGPGLSGVHADCRGAELAI